MEHRAKNIIGMAGLVFLLCITQTGLNYFAGTWSFFGRFAIMLESRPVHIGLIVCYSLSLAYMLRTWVVTIDIIMHNFVKAWTSGSKSVHILMA